MAGPFANVSGFRGRLFVMIFVAVALVTVFGSLLAQRYLSSIYEEDLRNSINQKIAAAAHTREVRQDVLADICADLAGEPRIHASLEDNALDLLYPSAANELRQIMREQPPELSEGTEFAINARFYRFLDLEGKVIPPEDPRQHGTLTDSIINSLQLPGIPEKQQIGYLPFSDQHEDHELVEMIAVPIISNETFRPIAALVVGFPFDIRSDFPPDENLAVGIWLNDRLVMPSLEPEDRKSLQQHLYKAIDAGPVPRLPAVDLGKTPYRLHLRPLNEGSDYPPATEVFLSSLAPLEMRQALARNRILITAAVILAIGLVAAHFTAKRLSRPVEELAVASEAEHRQRISAEVALDSTSRELERAARFSADASHQLKTPVAVVRAGLEEMLVDGGLPDHLKEEVRSLITHTGRLTHVIEDLLLLSRLDAGRLEVALRPENLLLIIDSLVDDLSVLPESEQLHIEVETNAPLWIQGNRSYTALILQSLLENAWKYNIPGGRIRIEAGKGDDHVEVRIGNTGDSIPPGRRAHIFERFHRGSSGENVPGYGLGLNLAAELTRLHGGRIELVLSEDNWTEFRVVFHAAESGNTTWPARS